MKFIYLVQGNASHDMYSFPENTDYLYLNWKEDRADKALNNEFYFPNSTWMSGRNELFKRACLKDDYDYFIFMDDDMVLSSKSNMSTVCIKNIFPGLKSNLVAGRFKKAFQNVADFFYSIKIKDDADWFEKFQHQVLKSHPMLTGPVQFDHPHCYQSRKLSEVQSVSYIDHSILCFHKSAALQLLPYSTDKESLENWWISSEWLHQKAFSLFPDKTTRLNRLVTFNLQAREYPRDKSIWTYVVPTVSKADTSELPSNTNKHSCYAVADDDVQWKDTSVVITTINSDRETMEIIDDKSVSLNFEFVVVGDKKGPDSLKLSHADFFSFKEQEKCIFELAAQMPVNHYSRKNLGYLKAISGGAKYILETDDDNFPLSSFWSRRCLHINSRRISSKGWKNIYQLFSNEKVWPRGFPIKHIVDGQPEVTGEEETYSPVQQGLADYDPDVDAIFRLTHFSETYFQDNLPVFLSEGQWCPFNSQNTFWDLSFVAPLMYLPSTCTFRETDILRSYVAQRILWTMGYGVLFHKATVLQERNEHDLISDFQGETRLYTSCESLCSDLEKLELKEGVEFIYDNLHECYKLLLERNFIENTEIELLQLWIRDLQKIWHTQ